MRAVLCGIAILSVLSACAGSAGRRPGESREAAAERMRASLDAGLDLYESGELVIAARRFHDAAAIAGSIGAVETERRATAGECLSWLRVRQLGELAECSERLERLQRRAPRADPGVNTLVALGAVAGGRPAPQLRIPNAVRPLIQESFRGSGR